LVVFTLEKCSLKKIIFWNYFFIIFENQITFWKLKEIRISLIEIKIFQIYISRYYNGRNNMGLICKWNFKNLTRNHQSYYKVLMNCVFAIFKKKIKLKAWVQKWNIDIQICIENFEQRGDSNVEMK
jgi:hypothetical protein